MSRFDFTQDESRDSSRIESNRQHLLPSLMLIAFLPFFFLSLSQIDFRWVDSTLRETNRAIRVESSTFPTIPTVDSLLALVFLSPSQIDFRWVESPTNLDESTHLGCIGQPSTMWQVVWKVIKNLGHQHFLKGYIVQHTRVDTCAHCDKTFSSSVIQQRHIQIHTGEKCHKWQRFDVALKMMSWWHLNIFFFR